MKNNISRKSFIQQLGIAGSGITLGFYYVSCGKNQKKMKLVNIGVDDFTADISLNPFVHIGKDGKITLFNPKPEMGQGTYQSMPILIAEELDVNIEDVIVKQAPAAEKFGNQGVGGSNSVSSMFLPMRRFGAAAREMLVLSAANKWGVTPDKCRTEKGKVIKIGTNESLSYGELIEGAKDLKMPDNPTLKPFENFQFLGKELPRKDIEWKVNGEANFGIDMKRENMVYASLVHSPNFGGKVKNIDDSQALAIKGVLKVIKTERKLFRYNNETVAVIADNYWSALKGSKALKVEWEEIPNPLNTAEIKERLKKGINEKGVIFSKPEKLNIKPYEMEAIYETPFLSHSQLEPQNALVSVEGDKCEIWAPTQVPDGCLGLVSEYLKIPKENVTIHVSFLGGGFGRRLLSDHILECCAIAKELKRPVKALWTREEDMSQGPYRPGSLNVLKGSVNPKNGEITNLYHKVVAPSIDVNLFSKEITKETVMWAMDAVAEPYYNVKNYESSFVNINIDPIPVSWWRSVCASTNVFAHESFIDELAIKAKKDPMDFRINQLSEKPRKVLEELKRISGWDNELPAGWGKGVAIGECFSTTAAHVVFVSKKGEKGIKIEKVFSVVNCGFAVNPLNVKAQVEGCVVMALSASIKGEITFDKGKTLQTNFDTFELPRINDMPPLEVYIMPSKEDPTGAGEPGLPPLAPALCNSIYDATKVRIRKLPLDLNNIG